MHFTVSHKSFLSFIDSYSLLNVCFSLEKSIFISILLMSSHVICIQVVFGLPLGLFIFLRYSSMVFLVSASEFNPMGCPSHVSLLTLTLSYLVIHGGSPSLSWKGRYLQQNPQCRQRYLTAEFDNSKYVSQIILHTWKWAWQGTEIHNRV